jgi:outer membrane protein OmpA-like peptidoglycan-associated protein/opacity protein-like surface antigen
LRAFQYRAKWETGFQVIHVRRNIRMRSQANSRLGRVLAVLAAMIVALCVCGAPAAAQDQPAPKWELYGGYSYFYPNARVYGLLPLGLQPVSAELEANARGAGGSITYDFNRWLGITLDGSDDCNCGGKTLADRINKASFANVSVGPKFTFRTEHFSPFFEALVGTHDLSPEAFHDIYKLGFMAGGGLDINLSKHVALRLIRADFVYSNYRYGPASVTPATDVRGVRAQSGIVIMWGGGGPPLLPSAACSVQPNEVFAGEGVTMTADGSNFNPKRTVVYNWNGTGVKVAGSGASVQIDTTGLPAGSYGATASLNDGSKNGAASCSARFIVKQAHPPVISCLANPASVPMGGTSTINSTASSPDGRRLIYSYTTSAGDISGSHDSATLATQGAQPGSITVTCNVSDDRIPPLTASSNTTVDVQAPPAPSPEVAQLEVRLALHSIYFPTARPTVENPTGGLVESQEQILLTLAQDFTKYLTYKPDAHLILGGHADQRGSQEYNKGLTERRVDRTKSFLVEHGIPADHIDTRSFGKDENLTADQVKEQLNQDPDLSPSDRDQMLNNLVVLVMANNRRVDVTLSTTGEQSVRRYPFNAKDYLALVNTAGGKGLSPARPAPKKKVTH